MWSSQTQDQPCTCSKSTCINLVFQVHICFWDMDVCIHLGLGLSFSPLFPFPTCLQMFGQLSSCLCVCPLFLTHCSSLSEANSHSVLSPRNVTTTHQSPRVLEPSFATSSSGFQYWVRNLNITTHECFNRLSEALFPLSHLWIQSNSTGRTSATYTRACKTH